MKFIRKLSENLAPNFEKNGKLKMFYPLFEVIDTFFLTPATRTSRGPHIRDKIDSKRFMITVVIALFPAILVGMYNIGYQAFLAKGMTVTLGDCLWTGFLVMLPVIIVTYAVGLGWEILFAIVRKHEMNEGFFVPLFCVPKEGYPPRKGTPAFRVPTKVGIPSPGTFSRGRYELAHSGAQTA